MSVEHAEQWNDVEDVGKAFPSDWIKQCEIAEAEAIDCLPAWAHAHTLDKAHFTLWIGVFEKKDIPKTFTIRLTHKRTIECTTDWSDGGCVVTDKDGKDVTGYDVCAYVSCAELRRILGKPRR